MGADFFETIEEIAQNEKNGIPNIGIGNDCEIREAIVDKNVRIGKGVKLINARGIKEETEENHVIQDGIIVIPKNTIIPDETVI